MYAWMVHTFTASGLLAAFMALISISDHEWRQAFIWLFICFVIDALDGTFARKFNVENVLPAMDGKSIDYVIDFTSYAVIPAFFFYEANMVDERFMVLAIGVILLSSALYYGKKDMVEDNQYFVGFPVLWNFVVFFQFFMLDNNQTINLYTTTLFATLHFVPLKFAYPSRAKSYFWWHLAVSIVGLVAAFMVLWQYPNSNNYLKYVAIAGGVYFFCFAIFSAIETKTNE